MFASKRRQRHSAIFLESASPRPEFHRQHCNRTISICTIISSSRRYDRAPRQDNTLRTRCTSILARRTTFHIRYANKCTPAANMRVEAAKSHSLLYTINHLGLTHEQLLLLIPNVSLSLSLYAVGFLLRGECCAYRISKLCARNIN